MAVQEAHPQHRITAGGKRKAAILLASLGPDVAAQVIKHLNDQEIEQVTMQLARTDDILAHERDDVLSEVMHVSSSPQTQVSRGGISYAKSALERAFGPSRAGEIIGRLSNTLAPRPFASLIGVDPVQLLTFLEGEHPQTTALVLAHMPPDVAAHVLKALPQDIQADVAERIATMDRTNPAVVARVEQLLEDKIAALLGADYSRPGGLDVVVALLNRLDRATERVITQTLGETNPQLAEDIRQRMILFEDLVLLDDRFIQRILQDVEQQDLVLALKGASQPVADRIYANMSSRQTELVQEDLKYLSAVRLRDVEAAQQRIVAVARKLEDAGEIIIARGGDDEVIA